MLIDAMLINLAAFGSFYLRFEVMGGIPLEYYQTIYITALSATAIYILVFFLFGLYNRLWQYASTGELLSIIYAVTVGTGGTVAVVYFYSQAQAGYRMPHTTAMLLWLCMVFLIGGSRFIWRILQENAFDRHVPGSQKQVLIVGAGDAGVLAARELKNRNYREGRPIGFIDDNRAKQKLHLFGIPVLGTRRILSALSKATMLMKSLLPCLRLQVSLCGRLFKYVKNPEST